MVRLAGFGERVTTVVRPASGSAAVALEACLVYCVIKFSAASLFIKGQGEGSWGKDGMREGVTDLLHGRDERAQARGRIRAWRGLVERICLCLCAHVVCTSVTVLCVLSGRVDRDGGCHVVGEDTAARRVADWERCWTEGEDCGSDAQQEE